MTENNKPIVLPQTDEQPSSYEESDDKERFANLRESEVKYLIKKKEIEAENNKWNKFWAFAGTILTTIVAIVGMLT